MIGNLKTITLAALFAGIATVFLVNELGIEVYPPTWSLPDGRWGYHDPAGVRFCIGARALAAMADMSSQRAWSDCQATLAAGNSLFAFNIRYWALIGSSAVTVLAAFGFALAVRFDRPPHRVLRGRRLLAGHQTRRGFIRSSKAEISQSRPGLEFLPGLTISREHEARHWLIWGSVGAGKTQTMSLPTLRPGHIPAAWSQQTVSVAETNPNQPMSGWHVRALSKDAADRIRDLGD